MSPPSPYGGPTALGFSKYASPHMKAQLAVPPSVSSTYSSPAKTIIATKQQIAASHNDVALEMARNSDTELAIASGNALKEEVDTHAAKFSRTVSTAVAQTRRLLELIRDALDIRNESALKTVDELWVELEQLFEAARGANSILPEFLEKQRNNMALYHGAVMNETYRESREELNVQHKKVNLQYGLILEHQQAFQDFKVSTAAKLKELDDLRERVSRLTLEKGNLKDEIDKYAQLLANGQSVEAEDKKKAKALTVSKEQSLAEVDGLRKTISDLQEKMQAAEQQITNRFTTELKVKTDLLAKETAKTTSLNALLSTLKAHESNTKTIIENLKAENKLINEKYNCMAAEHAQAFSKNKEQIQKIEALTTDSKRLREESAAMKDRLNKLAELEARNANLFQEKSDLLEQVGNLTMELKESKDHSVKLNKELASFTESLREVRSQNENLEVLLSKQKKLEDDAKKATQAFGIIKNENAKLKDQIDKLKTSSQAKPAIDGSCPSSSTDQNKVLLEQKIHELKEQKETLQQALDEWTALAKRSYKEYKDMLPIYKQAEQLQKSALEKEEQIKALTFELSSAKSSSKPNGVGAGGDAAFWKAKYENLTARVSI